MSLDEKLENIFLLKDEMNIKKRDKYDRFLFLYRKNKDIDHPIVSKNLNLNYNWPQGKKFAVALTHDIDEVRMSWKKTAWYLLQSFRHRKYKEMIKGIEEFFGRGKSPVDTFDRIMHLEKKYGAVSSFYFLATEGKDKRYGIENISDLLKRLDSEGFEIGLHGSRDSYIDASILQKEKAALEAAFGKEVVGIRQHYLCFSEKETWKVQQESGFIYDCTLGYADQPGFRNGCAHPFQAQVDGEQLSLFEIPLIIMDATLEYYLKKNFVKDKEELWNICTNLIDHVADVGGAVSLLWHNDRFDEVLHPGATDFYERLLRYIDEKNGWMTSGKNIIDHINKA